MQIELSDAEVEYLAAVLEAAVKEKIHELHHTDTAEYKELLRAELELVERLKVKLQG